MVEVSDRTENILLASGVAAIFFGAAVLFITREKPERKGPPHELKLLMGPAKIGKQKSANEE